MTATIAITMAGRGTRFREAGFDLPKYEIEVHGRSLFRWSMESLRDWTQAGAHFIFLARRDDAASAFIAAEAAAAGIVSHSVIEIAETTDGQATSALLAEPAVRDPKLPFVVYNIDTHVRPHAMRADAARGDGWIPCFPADGDHWSFAASDPSGRVTEVREKQRISRHATVGLYWFASWTTYADLYARHFSGERVDAAGERYIGPMYNTLIADGGVVRLAELERDDVVALGTPEDVARFAARDAS